MAAFLFFAGFLLLDLAGVAAALAWLSGQRAKQDPLDMRSRAGRGLPDGQR